MTERNFRKTREGIVVSDKMDKTVVVRVEDRAAHGLPRGERSDPVVRRIAAQAEIIERGGALIALRIGAVGNEPRVSAILGAVVGPNHFRIADNAVWQKC